MQLIMKLFQALEAKIEREYQTIVSISTPFKFSGGPQPSIKLVSLGNKIPLLDPLTREVFFISIAYVDYYYNIIIIIHHKSDQGS